MSSSFRSIPYTVTNTVSERPTCTRDDGTVYSPLYTNTLTKEQTPPIEYFPKVENNWRDAPTDGNWSQIKDSGAIKMTPMSVGKTTVENFVGGFLLDQHHVEIAFAGCSNCNNWHTHEAIPLHNEIFYTEQGDLTYWRAKFPNVPYIGLEETPNLRRLERIKSQAYQDLFQQYNLGEDLYELLETLKMLKSLLLRVFKLIFDFKRVILRLSNHPDKLKLLASAWLEFRYGIMPLVYSILDILELINDSEGNYRTVRRTYNVPGSLKPLPSNGTYFFETGAVSTVYRITVKGRWASRDAKIADLINVNLLTTALSVYKYSLVVRWFINLNSVIDSWVKSFTTSALEFNGCVAKRTSKDVRVFLTYEHDSRVSAFRSGYNSWCGRVTYPSSGPYNYGNVQSFTTLLQHYTEDSYERELFLPTDTKFVFDVNLSLKKILDAISMIIVSINRSLQGL